MKKFIYIVAGFSAAAFSLWSCSNFLNVEPKDKLTGDIIFSSESGVNAYIAGMYYNLPMECYRYDYLNGGDSDGNTYGYNNGRTGMGRVSMIAGPEAVGTDIADDASYTNSFNDWDQLYKFVRAFNEMKENISLVNLNDPAKTESIKQRMTGEYYFMIAYAYFELAKRYGGVPIITEAQEFDENFDKLKVPRSTEVDTWKFVLQMCDEAVKYLPDNDDQTRANIWSAYALKSRAALYAASVAKFWELGATTGEAVSQRLVGGFTAEDRDFFYSECMSASAEIIKSGRFSLNGENPASPEEASENYREVFIDCKDMSEVIFMREYQYPGISHSMGVFHEPNQLSREWGGRCCPTLDLVESYAVMDENGAAEYDVPIQTTVDGNEGYEDYTFKTDVNYKLYDNLSDIFANRDPRLYASVILPGTEWGGTTIVIQGGIRREDGSAIFLQNDPYEFNGTTYYGKGSSNNREYSGWETERSNGTTTGFLLKKYLTGGVTDQVMDQCTTPYPDMRYSEVLLNYAEAVAESGLPEIDGVSAKDALNKVHHRAAFKDDLELTTVNVRRERKSEMALDYTSIWDYWRRRELHDIFNNVNQRTGLVPMLDFTSGEMKYIFVRINVEQNRTPHNFRRETAYYRPIPGIQSNSLVQNPNY